MIYIITREGVYRHEILGIEDELIVAQSRAVELCAKESGFYSNTHNTSYHSIRVSQAEIGDFINDVEFVCAYKRDVRGTVVIVDEKDNPC